MCTDDANAIAPADGPSSSRRHAWARFLGRAALLALYLLASAAFAVGAASIAGGTAFHWQSLDLAVNAYPAARGGTRVVLAPLGEVRANTHRAPVILQVRLESIDLDQVRRLVDAPPRREQLERDLRHALRRATREFATRQVLVACLGALLVPAILRTRRPWWWIASVLAGGGTVAAALACVAIGYRPAAFQDPTYTGSLREARPIIAMARTAFGNAQALSDKLRSMAVGVNQLYGRIRMAGQPVDDNGAIHVLHISDIHNNLAAVDFVEELATRTPVDVVINTGDLTDLGTALEAGITRHIGRIRVPYVFVPGNHDSRATVRDVRKWRNAVVLDGRPVTVAGLRIVGVPDPASDREGLGSVDASPRAMAEAAGRLAMATAAASPPIDLVAVHNPVTAAGVIGHTPVVLCGHVHRASVATDRGTVVCNAGTTGAAGVRYFDRPEGVPFTAQMLAFSRVAPHRLLYIDQVEMSGALGHYSITRRTFGGEPSAVTGSAGPVD